MIAYCGLGGGESVWVLDPLSGQLTLKQCQWIRWMKSGIKRENSPTMASVTHSLCHLVVLWGVDLVHIVNSWLQKNRVVWSRFLKTMIAWGPIISELALDWKGARISKNTSASIQLHSACGECQGGESLERHVHTVNLPYIPGEAGRPSPFTRSDRMAVRYTSRWTLGL